MKLQFKYQKFQADAVIAQLRMSLTDSHIWRLLI